MIVKFKVILQDAFETFKKSLVEPTPLLTKEQYCNKEDVVGMFALDMDTVIDFHECRGYLNGELQECVIVRCKDNYWTPYLLISYHNFSVIYEKAKDLLIEDAEDII